MGSHSLIIQQLDATHPYQGKNLEYARETFQNVSYDSKPLILWKGSGKPHHPNFAAVNSRNLPPEYEVVGDVQGTHINTVGGVPLQMATGNISNAALDADIRRNPAAYGVSTGLLANIDNSGGKSRISSVEDTNHVLIFRIDENTIPNDPATAVCNLADQPIRSCPAEGGMVIKEKSMSNSNANTNAKPIGNVPEPVEDASGVNPGDAQAQIATLLAKIEELTQQNQQLQLQLMQAQAPAAAPPVPPEAAAELGNVSQQAAEINNLKAQVANLMAQNQQMKDDAEWDALQTKLPETMRGDANRKSYFADKTSFLGHALEVRAAFPAQSYTQSYPRTRVPLPRVATVDSGSTNPAANVNAVSFLPPAQQQEHVPLGNLIDTGDPDIDTYQGYFDGKTGHDFKINTRLLRGRADLRRRRA